MRRRSKGSRLRAVYGIHRVDHASSRTHSWTVRIQRRGIVWRRSFADGKHGGKAAALRAARAFRDEVIAGHPPMTRAAYAAIRRKNNRSGFPGVCRILDADRLGDGKIIRRSYWLAFWTTADGKQERRKFSIERLGEKKAFEGARKSREEGLTSLKSLHVSSRGFGKWLRRHTIGSDPAKLAARR
jgi:hypothetical protein